MKSRQSCQWVATTRLQWLRDARKRSSRSRFMDPALHECDKCGSEMQLKTGRSRKYFGLYQQRMQEHPHKLLKSGEAATTEDDPVKMQS